MRIKAQAMLDIVDRIAAENRARLAKLPPSARSWPTRAVALALVAKGLRTDAYAHLLAANWEPHAAARFVEHALANVPMRPVGLPVETVAQMQLEAGMPEAAWYTLTGNGWSPARAAAFLHYDPRVCGGGRGVTGRGPFMSAEELLSGGAEDYLGASTLVAPAPSPSPSPAVPLLVATAAVLGGIFYATRR
jgi:hypothetical protein